jgi:predicted ArsR family transcriptional regulator
MVKQTKPLFRHERFEKDVAITSAKMFRVLDLMVLLTKEHLRVPKIAEKLDTHPRTIHRYLAMLNALGMIDQDTYGRYFIPEHNCPICGKNHQQPTTNGRQEKHFTTA